MYIPNFIEPAFVFGIDRCLVKWTTISCIGTLDFTGFWFVQGLVEKGFTAMQNFINGL